MTATLRLAAQNSAQQRRIENAERTGSRVIVWPSAGSMEDESKWAFGYALSGSTVTIYSGYFEIDGKLSVLIAQQRINLTGSECWIYVKHVRNTSTATLATANADPGIAANEVRRKLYKFANDGSAWSLAKRFRRGNVELGSAMP